MMKKHLLLFKTLAIAIGLSLLGFNSLAQTQVGNSGFENWNDLGTDDEEPTNWNSFMTADCTLNSFICDLAQKQQVERSTDAHTGTYSARIWSREVAGIVANGNLTVGRIHMGSTTANDPSNYNYTDIADANFNEALTVHPDSLVVWVKYNPITTTSKARVSATIHNANNYRDPDDGSATNWVVAQAIENYGTTNGAWERISIPFDYIGPSTDAQYILISLTTNMTPGGGDGNDEVFIDDLELIYNTPSVSIAPVVAQNLTENQSGTQLSVTEGVTAQYPTSADARQWKSATTAGGPYTDIAGETGTTYTPLFTTAGTYYVICASTFGTTTINSNEVQINVTAAITNSISITPTASQSLIETQAGTDLTATEAPNAAVSRQWKSATTAGGPYTDIAGETGATYTPLFATAGTYYVVCVADFGGGDIQTSNEVEIQVSTFTAYITPNNGQTIDVNTNGIELTVSETPVANSREWKYSTTSGSGYVSFSTVETGTTYTPNFTAAGTYYVVCMSTIDGISVTSNEVEIIVEEAAGLEALIQNGINVYSNTSGLYVDLTKSNLAQPTVQIISLDGKIIANQTLKGKQVNHLKINVVKGIYLFTIYDNDKIYQGKVFLR